MHTIVKNSKAISTISLVILLFTCGLVGAVLSYLWTVGYYVDKEWRVPEGVTTVTIMNVTFLREDCTHFNLTLLHPTHSEADASITGFALITDTMEVKTPSSVKPSTPYPLKRGEDVTFKCNLNWGEFAGQILTVAVFIKEGSGAIRSHQTESVKLSITDVAYNTALTINHFNLTIRNISNIPLDVTNTRLGIDTIPTEQIFVNGQNTTWPYRIPENQSSIFTCHFPLWNAETNSGYLGTPTEITVETLQGYRALHLENFSKPVLLTLANVTYPKLNSTQFILKNSNQSPHSVNLDNVTISVGNQTFAVDSNITSGDMIEKGVNITVLCEDNRLDWNSWRGQKITIKVYTQQGFLAKLEEMVPLESYQQ